MYWEAAPPKMITGFVYTAVLWCIIFSFYSLCCNKQQFKSGRQYTKYYTIHGLNVNNTIYNVCYIWPGRQYLLFFRDLKSEENNIPKIILAQKCFGPNKFLGPKNDWSKKIWQTKFWPKNL